MNENRPRIIIIDDDPLVVHSLEAIVQKLGYCVVGVGFSGADAIKLYKEHNPELVLMDIRMDNQNGIEALKSIKEFDPNAKVLFITTFKEDEYLSNALSLGACGYILKHNISGIGSAIAASLSEQLVLDKDIGLSAKFNPTNTKSEESTFRTKPETINKMFDMGISEREIEVLELVALGLNNKEISEKLFLSEGTVRNYISSMLDKLDLRDRTQLAIYYIKGGIN